jgi:putative restriction endonuclease
MGGIYGKIATGAYSIIISGGSGADYDDRDLGDVVWYTGSGDTLKGDQPLTNMNKSLILSHNRQNPVRVIRTSHSQSEFAPSQGLRYDGLYKVEWYGKVPGRDGHKVWKFKMVRMLDQDPIKRNIPTAHELATLN